MNSLIQYILLHLTKDKSRNTPYAETHKHNIYKEFFAYLEYLGCTLEDWDKEYIKNYTDYIFHTIEKELE